MGLVNKTENDTFKWAMACGRIAKHGCVHLRCCAFVVKTLKKLQLLRNFKRELGFQGQTCLAWVPKLPTLLTHLSLRQICQLIGSWDCFKLF